MLLPTSLYIHIPWCIRKCPYCDFNSHKSPDILPETAYFNALLADLKTDYAAWPRQKLVSIFIGGGTPSLLSGEFYTTLLQNLKKIFYFEPNIEITLEANPGTVEQHRFKEYRQAGINRLSLGIQSFNENHIKRLGRIHDANQARGAIETARNAGFDNINLDIMNGLPEQTVNEGLQDLEMALSYQPEHLSWYQFTLEPNTFFYKHPPRLPSEDTCLTIEEKGFDLLVLKGYERYEISAFCQPSKQSQHNLNYWLFGDYFGIGAGAHGKITLPVTAQVIRTQKYRQPHEYLDPKKPFLASHELVKPHDLLFEFMLNTTRLQQPIPFTLFEARTGLFFSSLMPKLREAEEKGLVRVTKNDWRITELGRRFTNDLQCLFLIEDHEYNRGRSTT